jgi:hypothetical protein
LLKSLYRYWKSIKPPEEVEMKKTTSFLLIAVLCSSVLLSAGAESAHAQGTSITLEIGTERDITVNGIGYDDLSGLAVASGDINDDGIPDLIVGSVHPGSDPNQHAGQVYVLFGPLASGTYELSSEPDIVITGLTRHYQAGHGVAIGDLKVTTLELRS